jgi:AcrR family transcriptional regulator
VHLALGGPLMNCGYDPMPDGHYDVAPMAPQAFHSLHIAGEQVAFGVVAALVYRRRAGVGQRLSCAVHEAVSKNTETDLMAWVVQRQLYFRQTARHAGARVGEDITLAYTKDGARADQDDDVPTSDHPIRSQRSPVPSGRPLSGWDRQEGRRRRVMAAEKASRVRADPPVSLREAQKTLTRARLLQSAREVFEELGYLDTTVEEIADRVGASRGTFYLHFPSKAAVMREAVASWRSSLQHFTASLPAVHEPTFEELRAWVENYVDLYEQNKLLLRLASGRRGRARARARGGRRGGALRQAVDGRGPAAPDIPSRRTQRRRDQHPGAAPARTLRAFPRPVARARNASRPSHRRAGDRTLLVYDAVRRIASRRVARVGAAPGCSR